jgi:hypothetical protein
LPQFQKARIKNLQQFFRNIHTAAAQRSPILPQAFPRGSNSWYAQKRMQNKRLLPPDALLPNPKKSQHDCKILKRQREDTQPKQNKRQQRNTPNLNANFWTTPQHTNGDYYPP